MILELAIKTVATAVVVIVVTLTVARLGSRLGGIVAGTPIVLGPAFFFLGREQSAEFVAAAAVSTLHALTASLLFTMAYVLAAERRGAVASMALAALGWAVGAVVFTALPGGAGLALAVYAAVFVLVRLVQRRIWLPAAGARAPVRWPDLLLRGAVAGALVGVATTAGALAGPMLSGTLTGFPIGLLAIGLTLHQRFGAPVARATIAAAQGGMLSLVAFAATVAVTAPAWGGGIAFYCALAASLGVSALLFTAGHYLRGGEA